MQIRLLDADDWKALYVDGKLVFEGHSLSEVLSILFDNCRIAYIDELPSGTCPQAWDEKFEQTSYHYNLHRKGV